VSAVARCLWSLDALVALCPLWLRLFLAVPFLGVCVFVNKTKQNKTKQNKTKQNNKESKAV
jgi:hypothetical protein